MSPESSSSPAMPSPLLQHVPQSALDAIFGAAALVNHDLTLHVVSRKWDEFMARSGRSDLARNSVIGSSLIAFFRDEQQRHVFENLLASMASDELGNHNQVVDLGQKDSPFYVQMHIQPIWSNGLLVGYFLHCIDTTKEHANRLLLIDHDRQLHELRQHAEQYESELNAARNLIGNAAKEQAARESELSELREKAERKEKALKAAIKQAEISANNMAGKDHELELLQRRVKEMQEREHEQETGLKTLDATLQERTREIESLTEENGRLEGELAALRDHSQDESEDREGLTAELESARESIEKSRLEIDELRQKLAAAEEQLRDRERQMEQSGKGSSSDSESASDLEYLCDSLVEQSHEFGSEVCRAFRELTECKFAVCIGTDSETRTHRLLAEDGAPEYFRMQVSAGNTSISNQEGPCGIAAAPGDLMKLDHLLEHEDFAPWTELARQDQFQSLISIALMDGCGSFGAIQLFFEEEDVSLEEGMVAGATRLARQITPLLRLWVGGRGMDDRIQELRALLDAADIALGWIDVDGGVRFVGTALLTQMNLDSTPLSIDDMFNPEDSERIREFTRNPYGSDVLHLSGRSNAGSWALDVIPHYDNGQLSGCVLRAPRLAEPHADEHSEPEHDATSLNSGYRCLSTHVAQEFGDLLTTLVGHASLAAAELGEDSAVADDIRAIADSAGVAADLVRKLHALGGRTKQTGSADVGRALTRSIPEAENPDSPVRVDCDQTALEIILRAMNEHAEGVCTDDSESLCRVETAEDSARIVLSYRGVVAAPGGWFDNEPPSPRQPGYDLLFAREIARGYDGNVEMRENGNTVELVLHLPLSAAELSAECSE